MRGGAIRRGGEKRMRGKMGGGGELRREMNQVLFLKV